MEQGKLSVQVKGLLRVEEDESYPTSINDAHDAQVMIDRYA